MGDNRASTAGRRLTGLRSASTMAATVAAGLALATAAALPAAAEGQILAAGSPDAVAGSYIVVFKSGTAAEPAGMAARHRATITHTYSAALRGFAATMSENEAKRLAADPAVAYVEQNRTFSISETQSPVPSWGLDRIDQRDLPLNNSYTYPNTASNVTAYIIDTGIRFSHTTFGGRAVSGFDAIDGGSADDCHGHGTHVAGTVGGSQYGVAKAVRLVGVRVLNCQGSGTTAQVVAGIDWVTGNHQAGAPAVANMSLGGGADTAIDNAVRNSIADGVSYAIAAGNGNQLGIPQDACGSSPARVAEAITVGATQNNDAKASFSNYGTCLDIFAPGVNITSSWATGDTATNTISGTSMATPHVAGAAALYLSTNPAATPAQVRDALVANATPNKVTSPGTGSPNRLLFVGSGSTPPPPPPPPSGCANPTTGSLSGAGDADYYTGTGGFSAPAGTHRGCLDGPAGVDFDLYLQKYGYFGWSTVARGTSAAPDETVTYTGTAGTYRWRVVSYSGSGSYTFGFDRP